IVSMMLTPQHLADIQDINNKVRKVLETLKSKGIKIYLTGNWAHIASLKSAMPDLFVLFSGVFVSGDLHLLKPSQDFYETVLKKANVNFNQALWIETESKFVIAAKKYQLSVIHYDLNQNINNLITALNQHGLKV
nr:HAD hydrolase-like protein [Candidatus Babeliales bacterium]